MKKRLFAVAAASLLPALGILAYDEWSVRQSRSQEIARQAFEASHQTSTETVRILDGVEGVLSATSATPSVANGNRIPCITTLKTLVPSIQMIALIDGDGKLICDSLETPAGVDLSDQSYFNWLLKPAPALGDYTQRRKA